MLQEYIKSCGHLCDYYPKYHCELNFIEQYWGTAKLQFRVAGHARTLEEMKRKMLGCLDDIPLEQIRRCVIIPFFISALKLFSDSQTGLHTLFLPIIKVCPVPKQHGPTRNTMAIAFSPPIWSCLWRKWFQSSWYINWFMYCTYCTCMLGCGPKSSAFWMRTLLHDLLNAWWDSPKLEGLRGMLPFHPDLFFFFFFFSPQNLSISCDLTLGLDAYITRAGSGRLLP